MRTIPAISPLNDAQLVELSRDGDRDAFARIVERYQSLISGLTYSACGNLQASEDLAQVTFITAWCQLRNLREPAKLKSWLCRIARNATVDSFRQQQRTPTAGAETLDTTAAIPADPSTPRDHAISREEEAILWRSLGELPPTYREPLVLFYRQHQSVAEVADALDVTEDVIRQRLSRGRAMLAEQVTAFVEGALTRTAPGREFSGAVLAALPLAAGPAATAGLGAGAKGTAAAKSGFLAVWVAPFIGIFVGFAAQWLMIRAGATGRERRAKTIELIIAWILAVGFAVGGEYAVQLLGHHFRWNDRTYFEAKAGFWWFFWMVTATWISLVFWRSQARPQPREAAGELLPPAMTPLKPGTFALVVAGTHLMLFWCVIFLAWRAHDRTTVGIIAGIMLTMGIWHFLHSRDKTGAAGSRAYIGQIALCGAAILAIFNLRFDVWLASGYAVSVAETHRMFPIWMIPLLSLILVIWTGVFLTLTKPKRRSQ
jgi:RNA polymerase sigma factor (sigma-70 family)